MINVDVNSQLRDSTFRPLPLYNAFLSIFSLIRSSFIYLVSACSFMKIIIYICVCTNK